MAFDPMWIMAILAGLKQFGILDGKGGGEEGMAGGRTTRGERTLLEQPRGYQSPGLGLMDPAMMSMLLQNVGNYANWGGKSLDMPWIDKILELLGSEIGNITEGYGSSGRIRRREPNVRRNIQGY